MQLSNDTKELIRKEAEDHVSNVFNGGIWDEDSNALNMKSGYESGAIAWAVWKEKAEGAKAALESVNDILKVGGHIFPGSEASTKIKKALEQFH